MKQNSQWLPLQSFTHLTERAPLWAPDTASKQMQASYVCMPYAHTEILPQTGFTPRRIQFKYIYMLEINLKAEVYLQAHFLPP